MEKVTTERISRTNTEPWYAGMKNLIRRELYHERSRMYWIQQVLVWALFTNGFVALILGVSNGMIEGGMETMLVLSLAVFYGMMALFISIFIPILLQGTIIDEKISGTAAWILSKPVSKKAFILSKLIASILAIIVVSVIINGAIGYGVFSAFGFTLNISGYIMTLGLSSVVVIYFASLTVMLGTFATSRGKVLAAAVGLGLGAQILANYFPLVIFLIPYSLPVLGIGFITGTSVAGLELILLSACVQIIMFTVIAIAEFDRTEL
jgi:ABC-2 type transport system permease protein